MFSSFSFRIIYTNIKRPKEYMQVISTIKPGQSNDLDCSNGERLTCLACNEYLLNINVSVHHIINAQKIAKYLRAINARPHLLVTLKACFIIKYTAKCSGNNVWDI